MKKRVDAFASVGDVIHGPDIFHRTFDLRPRPFIPFKRLILTVFPPCLSILILCSSRTLSCPHLLAVPTR